MTHPDAVTIRVEPLGDGPTRRTVYHPRSDGRFDREEQLWRAAVDGWHTTGTETIEELHIDAPGVTK